MGKVLDLRGPQNYAARIRAVRNAFTKDVERRRNTAVWRLVQATGLSYAEVLEVWNEEEEGE